MSKGVEKDVPKDEVCIEGSFVYAVKHTPFKAGHERTDAYTDDQGSLGARFSSIFSRGGRRKCLCRNSAITEFKIASISNCL